MNTSASGWTGRVDWPATRERCSRSSSARRGRSGTVAAEAVGLEWHAGAVRAELGAHGQRAGLEVDVPPPQPERLGETQAGVGAGGGHRPERVAHPEEQELELVGGEVAGLALALRAWAVVATEVVDDVVRRRRPAARRR